MTTDDLLPLLRHMEWADALMWRAVLALPNDAQADAAIRARLLHIHLVQQLYLAMWRGTYVATFPKPDDFADLHALLAYARPYYAESLVQVAMHTTYHRGQVATQIRALGGEPPLTDFVAWIWIGKPEPSWPE